MVVSCVCVQSMRSPKFEADEDIDWHSPMARRPAHHPAHEEEDEVSSMHLTLCMSVPHLYVVYEGPTHALV